MRRSLISLVLLLLGGLLAAALGPAGGAAGSSDIAVVVHPEVKENNLSLDELRKVLLGDRQFWASKQRVTLIIRAPEARERTVVLKKIYQMDGAQFKQYWVAKVFRTEAPAGPKLVFSNEVATELVASIPGSIAFVEDSRLPRSLKLKVLKIDNLLPGEKGYPLR